MNTIHADIQAPARSCGAFPFRLKGFLGKRLDAMIANHVAAADIDYITAPFATHNERGGLWRTEFWGKFMHTAEPFAAYSGNAALRAKIDCGVERILAAQEASGYIGNYPDEKRFGKGWDIWGMKYTLMGLIHNYDGTGNEKALEAAKRLLDCVIAEIGPDGKRGRPLAQTGFCAGQPSLSILEPVMWLYNRTGEKRFLDFADYVVAQMDDPKVGPELIRLADVPVWRRNDPSKETIVWIGEWNRLKAYEMMSCYQGLIEYFEVTGRRDCFDAAVKTARLIIRDEINLAGGAAASEHWFHGAVKQHRPFVHLQETCVTITWMRLLEKLSTLTDDPLWADQFERTFFNAYLGALAPDGSEFAGYTPLSGYRFHGQHHCRMHTDCCNSNGPRGFLSFLRAAVRVKPDGIVIDQYASGIIDAHLPDGRAVGFDAYSLYPFENWLQLTSRTAGRYKVSLRIPAWSAKTEVFLNDEKLEGVTPGYLELDRDWTAGDAIRIVFDMPVKAHVCGGHVAFTRGPILLARDTRYGDGPIDEIVRPGDIADGATVPGDIFVRSPSDRYLMTIALPLALGSHHENPEGAHPTMVKFCDYASAGGEWTPANAYRTWFALEQYPWQEDER